MPDWSKSSAKDAHYVFRNGRIYIIANTPFKSNRFFQSGKNLQMPVIVGIERYVKGRDVIRSILCWILHN